jgi:hypothetical protein
LPRVQLDRLAVHLDRFGTFRREGLAAEPGGLVRLDVERVVAVARRASGSLRVLRPPAPEAGRAHNDAH